MAGGGGVVRGEREVGAPCTWTVRRPGRALRGAAAWGAGARGARRRRPGARPAGAQPVAFAAGGSVLCLAQGHGSATPVASLHGERHRPQSRALQSPRRLLMLLPRPPPPLRTDPSVPPLRACGSAGKLRGAACPGPCAAAAAWASPPGLTEPFPTASRVDIIGEANVFYRL